MYWNTFGLILSGEISLADDTFAKHDWIRMPAGKSVEAIAGLEGARLWIKRNHLAEIRVPGEA